MRHKVGPTVLSGNPVLLVADILQDGHARVLRSRGLCVIGWRRVWSIGWEGYDVWSWDQWLHRDMMVEDVPALVRAYHEAGGQGWLRGIR